MKKKTKTMTITEQKLFIHCPGKNPLRIKLRAMSDKDLLAELHESAKHTKRSKADWNYNFQIEIMCENRGIIKVGESISI